MITLVRRPAPNPWIGVITPLIAIVLTMVVGGMIFAAVLYTPVEGQGALARFWDLGLQAVGTMFYDPVFGEFNSHYIPQVVVKAAPLILIAAGLAVGFKAGIWNIGAEGQYIMGAIFGAAVALALYPSGPTEVWLLGEIDTNPPRWLLFPLMILAGALGGWLWAMIPALCRVVFRTNEILVSLMLVYVAEKLLAAVSLGLLQNPEGRGFPGSRNLAQWNEATNRVDLLRGWEVPFTDMTLPATGVHWGVAAALIALIFTYVLMTRHQMGFYIRLSGQSPAAARFAGVSPSRLVIFCLGLSGVLAGMAGLFEVAGPSSQITENFNVGYGFTAIIVAFLGRLHPVGILLAGLLMALTYVGGDLAQSRLQLPGAAVQVFQGMLLFFLLAMDVLTNYRIRIRRKAVA